jgi:hypothetical protein
LCVDRQKKRLHLGADIKSKSVHRTENTVDENRLSQTIQAEWHTLCSINRASRHFSLDYFLALNSRLKGQLNLLKRKHIMYKKILVPLDGLKRAEKIPARPANSILPNTLPKGALGKFLKEFLV